MCKKHNSYIIQYVEGLQCIINHHDINIILCDFNINFYHHLSINRHLTSVDLPKSLDVCGVEISVQLKAQSYGILHCTSNNIQRKLKNLIFHNYNGSTGFLLWLLSYCITCIFRQTVKAKYMFSLLTYDNTSEPAITDRFHKWWTRAKKLVPGWKTRRFRIKTFHFTSFSMGILQVS